MLRVIQIAHTRYVGFLILGCIECMRCRLLLPMFVVSVCLSRGSSRLHCAKMAAEQFKMLFGVNTLGPIKYCVRRRS